jgi:hypothetical protein
VDVLLAALAITRRDQFAFAFVVEAKPAKVLIII